MNRIKSSSCAFLVVLFALFLSSACAPVATDLTNVGAVTGALGNDSSTEVQEGQISLDKNFYLVIDGSGSMNANNCAGRTLSKNRLDTAKEAVLEFVNNNVPADVNLGLYAFDGYGMKERVSLGKDNRDIITQEIGKLRPGGTTPLDNAIKAGVHALARQRDKQLSYGNFYLIVATDGEADGDTQAKFGVQEALKYKIPIITIGMCLNKDHALAASSLSYRNANNRDEILTALQETQGEASTYRDATTFKK